MIKVFNSILFKIHKFIKIYIGYIFFKKSLIKISTYKELKEEINLPEQNSLDTEVLQISKKLKISKKNSWSIIQSIKYIKNNKIEGDFVESGIFEGNSVILFGLLLEKYNLKKKIYAYDTFDGMVKPSEFDQYLNKNIKYTPLDRYKKDGNKWMNASLEIVKTNILKYLNEIDHIKFIKGDVRETLTIEKNLPEKISLLRLDTDFYESTKKELEVLYPKLVKGGILIVDDYGFFSGSKKAVDEFLENKNIFFFPVDDYIRICLKL